MRTLPTIFLTLRTPKSEPPYLDIPPINVVLPKGRKRGEPTLLVWQLTTDRKNDKINALEDPISPGFAWIGGHPIRGIFSRPVLMSDGSLQMIDALDDEEKIGTFYYRISATIGGRVYRSKFASRFKAINPPRGDLPIAGGAMALLSLETPEAAMPLGGPRVNTTSNPLIKNR